MGYSIYDVLQDLELHKLSNNELEISDDLLRRICSISRESELKAIKLRLLLLFLFEESCKASEDGFEDSLVQAIGEYNESDCFLLEKKSNRTIVSSGYLPVGCKLIFENKNE